MGESLDIDAMISRFRDRAQAVRSRPLPPVAGEERMRFIRQAELDYQDFAILSDAAGAIEDGVLVLRVDLRPPEARQDPDPAAESPSE
jgi:hypothetical protein